MGSEMETGRVLCLSGRNEGSQYMSYCFSPPQEPPSLLQDHYTSAGCSQDLQNGFVNLSLSHSLSLTLSYLYCFHQVLCFQLK